MNSDFESNSQEQAVPLTRGSRRAPAAHSKKETGILGYVFAGLGIGVILVAVLVIVAAVLVPFIIGGKSFSIQTSSMEPTFGIGDMVIVQPVDSYDDLEVNDVITYQVESGVATYVTHRLIGKYDLIGNQYLVAQGDANDAADPYNITLEQVVGKVVYSVPKLGFISDFLNSGNNKVYIIIIIVALWLFYFIISAIIKKAKKR